MEAANIDIEKRNDVNTNKYKTLFLACFHAQICRCNSSVHKLVFIESKYN